MKTLATNHITSKQHEILLLLYRFRFLNRIQIQHFLNHKNDTRITSWLRDLTDKKILNRIYSQTVQEINKPAIYYLGLKSRPILQKDEKCHETLLKRVYREKHTKESFREHWLFLADLFFNFQKVAQDQKSELHFYTTTDLINFSYLPLPLPDAYIAVKGTNETKRYFIQLIDGNMRWFAVDTRIKQYISYFKGEYWQSHVNYPFPKILIVCPNTRLKTHLQRFIKEKLDEEGISINFYVGITADIQKRGIQPDTWDAI